MYTDEMIKEKIIKKETTCISLQKGNIKKKNCSKR